MGQFRPKVHLTLGYTVFSRLPLISDSSSKIKIILMYVRIMFYVCNILVLFWLVKKKSFSIKLSFTSIRHSTQRVFSHHARRKLISGCPTSDNKVLWRRRSVYTMDLIFQQRQETPEPCRLKWAADNIFFVVDRRRRRLLFGLVFWCVCIFYCFLYENVAVKCKMCFR